jgi:hypothetical protein
MNRTIIIRDDRIKSYAIDIIKKLPFDPIHKLKISKHCVTRSILQNKMMWACLADISKQVEWYGAYRSKEAWKIMITASWKQQDVVPGIDGGFVALGHSTSKMSVQEMSDVITVALAFGNERGVKWSDKYEGYIF